ncbi:MAG: hypothetical protein A2Z03_03875 [Chloroflexi bacterium RBG_16_56_8]|nr:MAG: hypothetical protein A2Z03_03875 [Chloroflexi bacterium RBG_16_56_8]
MNTIYIEPQQNKQVLRLVEAAVQGEVARLELALELAKKRLAPFEDKYHVSSEKFIATMAAEDLQGGDDEYVQWAGEYKLMQRLYEKLQQLKDLRFGN